MVGTKPAGRLNRISDVAPYSSILDASGASSQVHRRGQQPSDTFLEEWCYCTRDICIPWKLHRAGPV